MIQLGGSTVFLDETIHGVSLSCDELRLMTSCGNTQAELNKHAKSIGEAGRA